MESALRIPEKLFFRIGEVCDLIKVQPHVLRYWETEFPMLAPQKNRAGQRVYRRKDVEMVLRIRNLLYEEKFTIAGAKKKLQDEGIRGASRAKLDPLKPDSSKASMDALSEGPPGDNLDFVEADPVEPEPEPAAVTMSNSQLGLTPQAQRALRVIRHHLEDLLTMLNSNASINR